MEQRVYAKAVYDNDKMRGLKSAVDNGQMRMAMVYNADLTFELMERIAKLEEQLAGSAPANPEAVPEEAPPVAEAPVEEPKPARATAKQKPATLDE